MCMKLFKNLVCTLTAFFAMAMASAAVYPSSYDIVYHRISISVDPGTSKAITSGSVTTYFKTRINNFSSMGFDMDQALNVSSVLYHGSSAGITNSHSSNVLLINFSTPIAAAGTLDSITVNYSGTPVAPVTAVPSGYNYDATQKVIYTLGESFRGNTWWPCRDSLVDKIDSVDIIITTPSAYRAGSNGVVTETVVGANRICTWKTRTPIATYMINFCAAAYSNYQFNATALGKTFPVMNYLYPADNNATYQSNLNLLQTLVGSYATYLNCDYPFYTEKYGTAECGNTGWGALEVQSMTFIDKGSYGGSGYTLAHELAHQWFADKITTNDWHQIWLNEGFAQFFQQVIYPELTMSAATQQSQRVNLKGQVTTSSTTYVSNISNADNIFIGSGTQPYPKGAMILSMLRQWLGTAKFNTALHNYVTAPGISYNFTSVDSLKYYMQQQTPNDLTQFFNDWVMQKGYVKYAIKYQYVTNGVYIQFVSQTPTSAGAGYFDTPVPLQIKNSSGLDTTIVVIDRGGILYNSVNGQTFNANTIYFKLSATPTIAPVVDPQSAVLVNAGGTTVTSSTTLSGLITLPVQESSLNVTSSNNGAAINWTVKSDEPLDYVDIEKSADGLSFQPLQQTQTVATGSNEYSGLFTDNSVHNNDVVYYRLKIHTLAGRTVYSVVKKISLAKTVQMEVLPNPVVNTCTVRIPAAANLQNGQECKLVVFNSAGQAVYERKLNEGESMLSFSCTGLVPGVYNVALMSGKQVKYQSALIKQ